MRLPPFRVFGLGLSAALSLLGLLAGCGGERAAPAAATALRDPATALAAPALCADAEQGLRSAQGSVVHRQADGHCWRATTLLDATPTTVGLRRKALATAPTRPATTTELFDWAESAYAQFFPSHRSDLRLASFTYRYYPETQNHLAVSDGKIYVQGPLSGGELLYVGTVEEYTCRAKPTLCGLSADCAPPTSWSVAGLQCTPDANQTARVAHGATFTYSDSTAPVVGSATYQCSNGSLLAVGSPACLQEAQAACNTSGLTWTVNGSQCTADASSPAQLASGTTFTFADTSGTTGLASYRCSNGALIPEGGSSCAPPSQTRIDCTPVDIQWAVSGNQCIADSLPVSIADGATYTFADTRNGPVGSASFRCSAGTLQLQTGSTCAAPSMVDSFGGDGGPADGGSSADGTAGDGKPIVGGTVRIVDMRGKVATATTDTKGYWRAKITGMVPPLVVAVTRPDGVVRRSISTQSLKVNGYIFIAVTGLTDKIVSDLAVLAGFSGPAALTPAMIDSLGATAVANVIVALRNNPIVRPELLAVGINAGDFDPLYTPFRADGTGYDAVLDNLVIEADSTGQTSIRTVYCTVRQLSWTVNGATCTYGSETSSLLKLLSGTTLRFSDNTAPTIGSAGFSCSKGVLQGPENATCSTQSK